MAWLDIAVFLLIGGFGIRGFLSGFVGELLSLGAVIAGILAVRFFHPQATVLLTPYLKTEYAAALLAFVLLFTAVFLAGKMLAGWIGGRMRASSLGMADRFLGLGFGAVKGLLIATLGFVLFSIVFNALYGESASRPAWVRLARSYPLINASSEAVSDWVAESSRKGGLLSHIAGDAQSAGQGDASAP